MLRFSMPASDSDDGWFQVATDDVACSSEEEDNAKTSANIFLKATSTKTTTSSKPSRVKKVGPGEVLTSQIPTTHAFVAVDESIHVSKSKRVKLTVKVKFSNMIVCFLCVLDLTI